MPEFRCPRCRSDVDFVASPSDVACPACGERYPLIEGAIPDFVSDRKAPQNFVGAAFREDAAEYERHQRVEREHGQWVLDQLFAREPRLREKGARTVVEIGAGTGHVTRALASGSPFACERLYVTDLSAEMLTINWRQRDQGEQADRVRYLVCNSLDLPLPDASADMVVGFDILHHILDYPRGLREIARVLRPGGVCALKEPHAGAYRLLAWLCTLALRADRRWQPFSGLTRADREAIAGWERHFEGLLSANDRRDLESLAKVDDKYYFEPEALAREALECGFDDFSECNVLSRDGIDVPYVPMLLDSFAGLGLSRRGLSFVAEFLSDFDRLVGAQMLRRFPVNTVFLFWRESREPTDSRAGSAGPSKAAAFSARP